MMEVLCGVTYNFDDKVKAETNDSVEDEWCWKLIQLKLCTGEIQTMTAGNESEAQGSRGGAGRGRNGSWV